MSLYPKFQFNKIAPAAKAAKLAKLETEEQEALAPLAALARKQTSETSKLAQLHTNNFDRAVLVPGWQHRLCTAHADSNGWRGCCQVNIDDCLVSRIIESNGNLDRLRGLDLRHGINTDQIIDIWLDSGEPIADLLKEPVWFIVLAESLLAA